MPIATFHKGDRIAPDTLCADDIRQPSSTSSESVLGALENRMAPILEIGSQEKSISVINKKDCLDEAVPLCQILVIV